MNGQNGQGAPAPAAPATTASAAPASAVPTPPVTVQTWPQPNSPMLDGVRGRFQQAWRELGLGNAGDTGGDTSASAASTDPAVPNAPVTPTPAETASTDPASTEPASTEPASTEPTPVPPADTTTEDDEFARRLEAEFGDQTTTEPAAQSQPQSESEDDFDVTKAHPEVQKYLASKFGQKVYNNHRAAVEIGRVLKDYGVPMDPVVLREHVADAKVYANLLAGFEGRMGDQGRQQFIDFYFGVDPQTQQPYAGSAETLSAVIELAATRDDIAPQLFGRVLGEVRDSLAHRHNSITEAKERQWLVGAIDVMDRVLATVQGTNAPPNSGQSSPAGTSTTSADPKDAQIAELQARLAAATGTQNRSPQDVAMATAIGKHIRALGEQFTRIVGEPTSENLTFYQGLRSSYLQSVRAECMRDPQFAQDVRQVQTMGGKLQPSELAVISHRVESKMKAVAAAHMRANAANYRNVVAGRGVSKSALPGTPATAAPVSVSTPPPASPDPAAASARPQLTSTPHTGNMNPSGAFAGSGRPQQSQTASDGPRPGVTAGKAAYDIATQLVREKLGLTS